MTDPREQGSDVYVAVEGFSAQVDGAPIIVAAGERVRAGHPVLRVYGGYFRPVDYDLEPIEQATAEPGRQRGAQRGRRVAGSA